VASHTGASSCGLGLNNNVVSAQPPLDSVIEPPRVVGRDENVSIASAGSDTSVREQEIRSLQDLAAHFDAALKEHFSSVTTALNNFDARLQQLEDRQGAIAPSAREQTPSLGRVRV
jgi:hypothetical protein